MTEDQAVFGGAGRADDFDETSGVSTVAAIRAEARPREVEAPAAAEAPQEAPRPAAEPVELAPEVEAPQVEPEPVDPARLLAAAIPSAARVETPTRARQGWRGALARVGLPLAPGAQETAAIAQAQAVEAARTTIRQATWTRAVSILVGNPKGGTGKTPVALALGGILASVRGGDVVVVEVSDDPGALGFRAEGSPSLGLGEFVRDVDQLTTKGQVAGYTAPQTSFASVIGTVEGTRRPPLTYDDVTEVAAKLDEHFEIRVMDSGNQPSSGAFRGAAATADVLVIPVMNAGDSTLEALGMLRELRTTEAGRRLADHAIVVVADDGRPQDAHMRETVPKALAGAGIKTLHQMPYDAHIATRGEVTLDRLAPATTEALTMVAASVIRALNVAAVPAGRRAQPTRNESKDTH